MVPSPSRISLLTSWRDFPGTMKRIFSFSSSASASPIFSCRNARRYPSTATTFNVPSTRSKRSPIWAGFASLVDTAKRVWPIIFFNVSFGRVRREDWETAGSSGKSEAGIPRIVYWVWEPNICVSIFSSDWMVTVSLGIFRIISRKILAVRIISPSSTMAASIPVDMASSKS